VGDATLSQERFRTNPFTGASGDRLYRTGDRGRYRTDGSVEYLGRIDGQVKVRGFRVELGEIASTLERHPAVARAVLSTHEDGRGERALCAYVKYRDGLEKQPSREELREHLAGLLPDYMVPAAFVVLDTVPLTPNGKVDLRALPPPQVGAPAPEEEFVAPSTPTEEAIAAIWSEVLGVGPLSVNRSFFEVGGHSLAATQVVSRLRSTFELELPLNTLFQAKTIAGLATAIEDAITAEINALSDEEAETLAAASSDDT
jgi:acyl carrier protein